MTEYALTRYGRSRHIPAEGRFLRCGGRFFRWSRDRRLSLDWPVCQRCRTAPGYAPVAPASEMSPGQPRMSP